MLLLCTALLSGCSLMRLTYPQAPTLAYWWIDGYVDFTGAQTPKVQDQLADWLRWHRATQLNDYVALLRQARGEAMANTTPAQVCRWFDELTLRAMRSYDQILPAAAEFALAMSPAQLEHVQHKFDKTNAEFRDDFLQPTSADRLKESVKRAVERAESLYGKLDDAQRERIAREVAASPFDPVIWNGEREARQRDILQTLRRLQVERASVPQAQAALRTLAEQVQNSPNPAMREAQQRLEHYGCEVAARFHNSTNAKQRRYAAERFKGWEDDVRALAAQPQAPSGPPPT